MATAWLPSFGLSAVRRRPLLLASWQRGLISVYLLPHYVAHADKQPARLPYLPARTFAPAPRFAFPWKKWNSFGNFYLISHYASLHYMPYLYKYIYIYMFLYTYGYIGYISSVRLVCLIYRITFD